MTDSCPEEEMLSLFHDNEVQDKSLHSHIENCAKCRAVLDSYTQLDVLIRAAEPVIEKVPKPSSWRVPALVAASLVLSLGLTTYYINPSRPTTTETHYMAADGRDYIISLEGGAYLVSMQIGSAVVKYRED